MVSLSPSFAGAGHTSIEILFGRTSICEIFTILHAYWILQIVMTFIKVISRISHSITAYVQFGFDDRHLKVLKIFQCNEQSTPFTKVHPSVRWFRKVIFTLISIYLRCIKSTKHFSPMTSTQQQCRKSKRLCENFFFVFCMIGLLLHKLHVTPMCYTFDKHRQIRFSLRNAQLLAYNLCEDLISLLYWIFENISIALKQWEMNNNVNTNYACFNMRTTIFPCKARNFPNRFGHWCLKQFKFIIKCQMFLENRNNNRIKKKKLKQRREEKKQKSIFVFVQLHSISA